VEIREADGEILKALVGRRSARMATVDFMVDCAGCRMQVDLGPMSWTALDFAHRSVLLGPF
jgi:hypothetical protein